jgi:hypothetical protein
MRRWWLLAAALAGTLALFAVLAVVAFSTSSHTTLPARTPSVRPVRRAAPVPTPTVPAGSAQAAQPARVTRPAPKFLRQGASAPALDGNAQGSFASLVTRLGLEGRLALAIEPLGRGSIEVLGGDPAMQAMSTSKILILSALLRDRGGVNNLTAEQHSLAEAAVTESDNDAILALFSDLEADHGGLLGASAYATSLLRGVGDNHTQVATAPPPPGYATTFGQTPWTPTAEVTFFRSLALGCVLPPADTSYLLGLMRRIEPSESFGLGSAGLPQVAFKGGWGPEPGDQYGVRQTGIIGGGDSGVVVSITADPVSTFEAGQSVLDQVARWLRAEMRIVPRPPAGCPA